MLRFVALSSQVLLNVIVEELIVAQVYFESTVCQVCYKVKQFARVKSSTWRVKFKCCWVHAVEQVSPVMLVKPVDCAAGYHLWRSMSSMHLALERQRSKVKYEERWLMSCRWVRSPKNDDWWVVGGYAAWRRWLISLAWSEETFPNKFLHNKLADRLRLVSHPVQSSAQELLRTKLRELLVVMKVEARIKEGRSR